MNDFVPDEDFLKTLTVVYVEDDTETREQLSLFLRRRVGTLVTANNGIAGLEAFRARRVRMVVTDVQMPEMDGLAMVHEIRKLDRNVPIIVTTAFEQTDYFLRSIDIGVDKYVTKPINAEGLYAAMLQLGRRLQEEEVSKRVSMLLHKSQLQSMASELALAEERERRRIADGLHDQVVQNLAAAALTLDGLEHSMPAEEDCAAIRAVRAVVGAVIADLRSLAFDLSPPVLFELGLETALRCLAEQVEREHGIQVEYIDDGQEKPVDNDLRVTLYRSTRELMINVVKHAHAANAKISMTRGDDGIHILVEDDGRGFDGGAIYSKFSAGGGFGLSSIRERLGILGGAVKIDSQVDGGTRITLVAPLTARYSA